MTTDTHRSTPAFARTEATGGPTPAHAPLARTTPADSTREGSVTPAMRRLIIAARRLLDIGYGPGDAEMRELDLASDAFAAAVPFDDEPAAEPAAPAVSSTNVYAGAFGIAGAMLASATDPSPEDQRANFERIAAMPVPSAVAIKAALERLEAIIRLLLGIDRKADWTGTAAFDLRAMVGMLDRLAVEVLFLEGERDGLRGQLDTIASNAQPVNGTDLADLVQRARRTIDALSPTAVRKPLERTTADLIGELVATVNDQARRRLEAEGQAANADTFRRRAEAVNRQIARPPSNVERTLEKPEAQRTAAEAAELALWAVEVQANAIRFVAELATMTDTEADFLDGHEVRSIATLLQVPDDSGAVAPTVPRLYTEQDRDRAVSALIALPPMRARDTERDSARLCVDTVAEALGMRKAGA